MTYRRLLSNIIHENIIAQDIANIIDKIRDNTCEIYPIFSNYNSFRTSERIFHQSILLLEWIESF